MKRITYSFSLLITLLTTSVIAQTRYVDSIFSKIKTETFTYSDTLKLDFYSAKEDSVNEKPLLVLVHGGGFAVGKKDNSLEKRFSIQMAQKGYAVASISYRLTRKGKGFGCDCPVKEKLSTFKLTTSDILKAIQYLTDKAEKLGFDSDKIVLVGSSAGAEAVLNTAFLSKHRDFKNLRYTNERFAGVISFSGAILNTQYITKDNAIPTMLFHGAKDRLVPFGTAPHHFCKDTTAGFLMLDGSKSIAYALKKTDTPFALYYDPNGNHDWANKAYRYSGEIAHFIKNIIIDQKHIQITRNLSIKK